MPEDHVSLVQKPSYWQTKKVIQEKELDLYWQEFHRNPGSPVFALLVEGLRQRGQLEKALQVGLEGLSKNPGYHGGYLALARVYLDMQKYPEALNHLKRSLELNPQNTLALKLLTEVYMMMKDLNNALRTYKMAAFLGARDPQLEAQLEKLENLETFDWEGWQKTHLNSHSKSDSAKTPKSEPQTATSEQLTSSISRSQATEPPEAPPKRPGNAKIQSQNWDFYLQRQLAYVDTLVHRGEVMAALERLNELEDLFPNSPEIELRKKSILQTLDGEQPPPELKPQWDRHAWVLEKKLQWLRSRLKALSALRLKALKGEFLTETDR